MFLRLVKAIPNRVIEQCHPRISHAQTWLRRDDDNFKHHHRKWLNISLGSVLLPEIKTNILVLCKCSSLRKHEDYQDVILAIQEKAKIRFAIKNSRC